MISATSVRLSAPMTLALNSRLSVSLTGDFVGGIDDVRVGQDVAVGADDEAEPSEWFSKSRVRWGDSESWLICSRATGPPDRQSVTRGEKNRSREAYRGYRHPRARHRAGPLTNPFRDGRKLQVAQLVRFW